MGLITDIIKGLPLSAVLEDKLRQLEKRFEAIESENGRLHAENSALRARLDSISAQQQFEEVEGLLWKRKSSGGYESKPRCPNCPEHPVLFDFPPGDKMFWNCSRCKGTFDYADPPAA